MNYDVDNYDNLAVAVLDYYCDKVNVDTARVHKYYESAKKDFLHVDYYENGEKQIYKVEDAKESGSKIRPMKH